MWNKKQIDIKTASKKKKKLNNLHIFTFPPNSYFSVFICNTTDTYIYKL